jgi:hypothetical protein
LQLIFISILQFLFYPLQTLKFASLASRLPLARYWFQKRVYCSCAGYEPRTAWRPPNKNFRFFLLCAERIFSVFVVFCIWHNLLAILRADLRADLRACLRACLRADLRADLPV